ncbi:MAG: transposase, partial [Pseudomonadota bacterium]
IELYARQIVDLCNEIRHLDNALKSSAMKSKETRRMQTMPGIGPISAHAIQAYCPPMEQFRKGRDFAAWLGLVPRQNSTGGKVRLGRVTKMGQRDIRRLLITGAMAVITAFERRERQGDPWLAKMLEKRPRIVAAVALANRMARRLWAMLSEEENYEIRGAA